MHLLAAHLTVSRRCGSSLLGLVSGAVQGDGLMPEVGGTGCFAFCIGVETLSLNQPFALVCLPPFGVGGVVCDAGGDLPFSGL